MIPALLLIILGVLILTSYLDIKYKAVPSVILTSMILVVLLLRSNNLYFGVVAFVFAILIKDLISDVAGLEFGMADVKIFIMMGLLVGNLFNIFLLIIIFLIFQFVYTIVWRWKVSKEDEMPFIPCLLVVYITMILIGGFA
ncbi:MAG: hypothetical protein DRN27_06475 [Thermoplasmata archaeon]|nr:MAG: hypothetical protein DRN27_06475 [Thermoplasmata archaeon]